MFGQSAGQGLPDTDPGTTGRLFTAYDSAPGTGVVELSVTSENTHTPLDRQALVKLVNLSSKTAIWQTTEEGAKAIVPNVPFGSYTVEVSAVGYVTSAQRLDMVTLARVKEMKVALQKDPSAIQLDVDDTAISSKGRKELKRAIAALKSNNLKEAQHRLDLVRTSSPNSPQVNFLYGYLQFQKQEYEQAGHYLTVALEQQPNNIQALILLGRSDLERDDYRGAQAPLRQAIELDGGAWLPHSLLAESLLHQGDDRGAREQALLALEKGGSAANPARLVLGQAALNLGQDQEGIQALQAFLQNAPSSPLSPQVRKLIADASGRHSSATSNEASTARKDSLRLDALQLMPTIAVPINSWQPTGIDEVKPSVAAGVSCPLDTVLQGAGSRVAQLVDDVSRFAAIEDLFHQRLDRYGVPERTDTRKFNYVASISEPEPGYLEVDEYRAEKLTLEGYPDHIASTGFATLAFVFHPHVQDDFAMQCEGLGNWQGLATWLVHFRQRDDRPNRMHSYKMNSQIYPVSLKGRAWVRADNFQIVRMESELVKPMPQIRLLSEHQIVEYGPVPFGKTGTVLWLPKSAQIYFDFRRQLYYRRHSFDHYMLFAVNSDEKRKEPTVSASPKPPQEAPQ
jgi:tetratricopeptide (TPR) repeat protein